MSILISLLLIVEVLAAFLLIVVILAQKSKDQGLGMAFGSGMGESLFGSRAGNVLTRMTVTLATTFMVTTILLGYLFANRSVGGSGSVMEKADREAPMAPMAMPAPAAPVSMDEMPMAPLTEETSEPMMLQMGEGGELAPLEAAAPAEELIPVAEAMPADASPVETAPAEAAPAMEGETAPQD